MIIYANLAKTWSVFMFAEAVGASSFKFPLCSCFIYPVDFGLPEYSSERVNILQLFQL